MNLVVGLEQRFEATPDRKVWTPGPFAYSVLAEVSGRLRSRARRRPRAPGRHRHPGMGRSRRPGSLLRTRDSLHRPLAVPPSPTPDLGRRPGRRGAVRRGHPPRGLAGRHLPGAAATPRGAAVRRGGCRRSVRRLLPGGRQASTAAILPLVVPAPIAPAGCRSLRRRLCHGAGPATPLSTRGRSFSTHSSSVEPPKDSFLPCEGRVYSTHYSDVELPELAFAPLSRPTRQNDCLIRLIFVGTLEQLYKAPDVLLDAVGQCFRQGLDLELVLVGRGKYQQQLEARAEALGLGLRVRFLGQLPAGEAVRNDLDRADLFVLPSRQEGLPRAMIEAMARGLPCIGSTVGGIPELLEAENLVPPGDAMALAAKIREVVTDPERMARMSARNLAKAREYSDEVLRERRLAFYRYVREATETWIRAEN